MARFFFALDISPKDKAEIAELQQQIFPALPKPTAPENLHLTLVFLGNISPQHIEKLVTKAEFIAKQMVNKTTYQLTAEHLGVFAKAKVLFLGISDTPQWLQFLASELESAAKIENMRIDDRAYLPHITISRKVKSLPASIDFNINLSISSFSLYISESTEHGVSYTPIKTFEISKHQIEKHFNPLI